ncbi:MAG: FtsQ-type POTRA domain-containing protein [Armatimonadota bacterium]|nr:FtsQ-type POTRA domain-containing protein [bacterium]
MRRASNRGSVRRATRSAKRSSRNKAKPNYRFLFFILFASTFMSGVITYALRTPGLDVSEVKVEGVRLADKATVQNVARSMLRKNILLLRKGPVVSRITSLSEVRDVKIGRCLPDKVWVKVAERKPDAVVTDGSNFFMIQSDGLMFHKVGGPVPGVPVIDVDKCEPLKAGKIATSAAVKYGLETLKDARAAKLALSKISIDHGLDICLNMRSGFYVKLGQPDDIARKMSRLRQALTYRPSIARDALYMDVSCPRSTVWMPRQYVQNLRDTQ